MVGASVALPMIIQSLFFEGAKLFKGTHESLIMDAVYVLQELLEGITYQEFCWELSTC
jgi:hypothetical protein